MLIDFKLGENSPTVERNIMWHVFKAVRSKIDRKYNDGRFSTCTVKLTLENIVWASIFIAL